MCNLLGVCRSVPGALENLPDDYEYEPPIGELGIQYTTVDSLLLGGGYLWSVSYPRFIRFQMLAQNGEEGVIQELTVYRIGVFSEDIILWRMNPQGTEVSSTFIKERINFIQLPDGRYYLRNTPT